MALTDYGNPNYAFSNYLGDISGTVTEWAWSSGLDDWVANGGNANDWYQDMLEAYPQDKQALFDIYKTYIDKYGFYEGTPPGTMTRDRAGNANPPRPAAPVGASMWPTNEAAFIAVALGVLAIAVYALKEKR